MSEPKVIFTPWKQWDERKDIKNAERTGVYLLAHFSRRPNRDVPASPLDEHIVYIGETHRQTLQKRWSDFNRSAQTGKKGHAGGRTYHDRFSRIRDDLYVAAYTPEQPDWTPRCRSFFISRVESRLIWNSATACKPDKLCNKD